MRHTHAAGIRIRGVASAVPDQIITAANEAAVFGTSEMEKLSVTTGIRERRIVPEGVCTSDLCIAAADVLLDTLRITRDSLDALILVTQTPDYVLPATSCSLHGRMNLPVSCAAFDVNLGCSGYTYGLWLASHLIAGGAAARILLLAGETSSRLVNARDRSAKPLFGDAGSATIVEADSTANSLRFVFGTDGGGQNDLLVPAGGFRLHNSDHALAPQIGADGNTRRLVDLHMDGSAVFNFTLDRVIPLVREALRDAEWTPEMVDAAVFHQANEFMLKHIAKAVKLPWDRVPCSLSQYGNTSSASIPLTLTTQVARNGAIPSGRLLMAGFGVGLSWCSATVQSETVAAPPLVEVSTSSIIRELFDASAESASHLPAQLRNCYRHD